MDEWATRKGREGIKQYWRDNNAMSIDGLAGIT
jgi:hypothetical protein